MTDINATIIDLIRQGDVGGVAIALTDPGVNVFYVDPATGDGFVATAARSSDSAVTAVLLNFGVPIHTQARGESPHTILESLEKRLKSELRRIEDTRDVLSRFAPTATVNTVEALLGLDIDSGSTSVTISPAAPPPALDLPSDDDVQSTSSTASISRFRLEPPSSPPPPLQPQKPHFGDDEKQRFLDACGTNDPVYGIGIVKSFIETYGAGLIVNCCDHNRDRPLHYAARSAVYEVAELLLKHGASRDLENRDGKLPLDFATMRRAWARTDYLDAHRDIHEGYPDGDAPEDEKDDFYYTKLLFAQATSTRAIVEYYDPHKRPTVFDLVRAGDLFGLRRLLENTKNKNAILNKRDKQYRGTPLHMAVFYRRPLIVELLVEHGANVNARDGHQRRPCNVYDIDRGKYPGELGVIIRKCLGMSV